MTFQEATNHLASVFTSWVIYIGTPVASAVMSLYAVTDPTLVGSLISSLGVSGILVWYVYYHVKFVEPRRDERQDQRDALMREHYEGIIEKIESNDKEKNEKLCASIDGLAKAMNCPRPDQTTHQHDAGEHGS